MKPALPLIDPPPALKRPARATPSERRQAHRLRALLLQTGLLCISLQAALAQAQADPANSAPAPAARSHLVRPAGQSDLVLLQFDNTEISELARAIALITGRTVVLDPRVKGTVSLHSDRPISRTAAFNQFAAALRLQGFAVIDTAGIYKVVPEAEAKLQALGVSESAVPPPGQQMATQIFKLSHENASNLVAVLRPLISPNNTISLNPGTNSLVVTDYADNLRRIGRIIAALDLPNASDLEIFPLKHAIASDIVPLLQQLLQTQTAGAGPAAAEPGFRTVVLAEPRTNAVILRAANAARLALARGLLDRLDRPSSEGAGSAGPIRVVYLRNAQATQLAATLRAALSSSTPAPAATTAAPTAGAGAPVPAAAGQIQADAATNALIISAPEPQYRQLRAVIDQLDTRRAQVLVESLIVEVRADKAEEFGIQWQRLLGNRGDATLGFIGTNFGTAGNNILNLQAQGANISLTPGAGINFGWLSRSGNAYTLGLLGRFLQESGDGNILSTPTLLTLDNEEARIVVGQNVPFITGQYTSTPTGTTGVVNPFQTIERRDVGLTLRVKPQISENGTVRMQIFQEVSSISPTLNTSGLITNKRSIESNVLVEDGSIVALGGLLQDEFSGNQDEVPGLSKLPILGHLFRSEARKRNKSNLMVFLRPVVVRDAASSQALALDRYELMRGLQKDLQIPAHPVLQLQSNPGLPPALSGPPAAPGTSAPASGRP